MNNVLSLIVGVVIVVGVGGFVFWQKSAEDAEFQLNSVEVVPTISNQPQQAGQAGVVNEETNEIENENTTVQTDPQDTEAPTPDSSSDGITSAVVAEHSTRASCWSSINGNVYDLTSWIPKHPGGEQAILQLCGTDGSTKFNRKHGGDAPKEKILFGFKVGVLAQ